MGTLETGVVVLGAGFAGLACAEQLAQAGVDFVVLEARDRVGGRAWTDATTIPGFRAELGAMMIHGRNVVTQQYVSRFGLRTEPLLRLRAIHLALDQRVSAFPWMALPFHPVVGPRRLHAALVRVPRELARAEGPDRSLENYLSLRAAPAATRALVELNHAHIFAMDPDAIGVLGPAEETRAAPTPWDYRNYRIVQGYSELASRLAASVQSHLRLRTMVGSVRWNSGEFGVRVEAVSEGASWSVKADQAVVTFPLGVLQSDSVVFEPTLPEEKRRAIGELVMADAFTMHVRVHGGTLRRTLGVPSFLWGRTPSSFFLARPSGSSEDVVVSAFTVGREARRRVAMADSELVDATLHELQEILPLGTQLGSPGPATVHRWSSDPLARGAYSCIPVDGRLRARQELARPLEPGLYFAGEATHCHGAASTVHGAIETGRRAAQELMESRTA